MNAYETYKAYLGLKRHFTTAQYDYFKYNGKIATSPEAFLKRNDVNQFLKLSQHIDPNNLMIGNFILSRSSVSSRVMSEEFYVQFMSLKKNVAYHFKNDLKKFKPDLVSNLVIDKNSSVPYIIDLYSRDEIKLSTMAVFEGIFSCKSKWEKSEEYFLFENTSKKIAKAWQFFDIPIDKYTEAVRTVFSLN